MSGIVEVEYMECDGTQKKRLFRVTADSGAEVLGKLGWIHRIFDTCIRNEVIAHFAVLNDKGEVVMDAKGNLLVA